MGKLSQWAILKSLEPKLGNDKEIETLSRAGLSQEFIQTMMKNFQLFRGSLDRLCREASRIKVREAMVPVRESIDEKEPLTEAIHLFVLTHVQSTLVTRKDQVVGILRLSDVFEEVADMIRGMDDLG